MIIHHLKIPIYKLLLYYVIQCSTTCKNLKHILGNAEKVHFLMNRNYNIQKLLASNIIPLRDHISKRPAITLCLHIIMLKGPRLRNSIRCHPSAKQLPSCCRVTKQTPCVGGRLTRGPSPPPLGVGPARGPRDLDSIKYSPLLPACYLAGL
jgi:hypothetical protein